MTQREFWDAEAKSEGQGRHGYELAAEMLDDIQNEYDREARNMKDDPTEILRVLRSYYVPEDDSWEWDEGDEPAWVPESIIEVGSVEVGGGFKSGGWKAVVEARCSDGETRRLKIVYSQDNGSFYEPPSDDLQVEVL